MKHARFWLIVLALAASELRADTTLVVPTEPASNITIKLSSPAVAVPRFGFLPVRVAIENLTARDGVWRFRFEAGQRFAFPGLAGSTFEVAVPSPQTREVWLFVPLAEPGMNPGVAPIPLATSIAAGTVPPMIDGVYPTSPPGVSSPQVSTHTAAAAGGIVRTFTITQAGPVAALPPLAGVKLPPRASSSVSAPDAAGNVVRTTIVPVEILPSALGLTTSSMASRNTSSMSTVVTDARDKLAKAGLSVLSETSSARMNGATNEVTVTIRQAGSASILVAPPLASLPPGFTGVLVNPGVNAGDVVREFTYVEKLPPPPSQAAGGRGGSGAFSVGMAGSPTAGRAPAEAEARKILAGTNLLSPPAGVRSSPAQPMMMPLRSAVSGPSTFLYPLVVFEQTGPAAALPFAPPASLPPGVRVSLHPSPVSGEVTRIISVLNAADYATIRAASTAASAPSAVNEQMNLIRLELQRLGYLRPIRGVQPTSSIRSTSGATAATTMIFTESGPSNLLPAVPAGVLPAGFTSNITPSPMPGEVSRNFIVDIAAAMAGFGPLGATPGSAGAAPARVAAPTGGGRPPGGAPPGPPSSLMIEVTGPGITTAKIAFPAPAATNLPPVAVAAGIDAALRARLVASGLRFSPNFAPVEAAQLPADWRVWSSFNAVILRVEDFTALDAARRGALRQWVGLGGLLFLVPMTPFDLENEDPRTEHVGAGRVERLATPLPDLPAADVYPAFQLDRLAPGMPDRDRVRLEPGTALGDIVKFTPENVTWLLLLLITFAFLIGPLNLYLFAPAKKRHRLFFTTPLISLVGAAAVAGAILLQDGLGGEGARRALVVFLPGQNQAAVFQEQATHHGFLVRRSFPLHDSVLCSALPTDDVPLGNLGSPLLLERERGLAVGDWFRNRSRQALLLRQLVPSRARVELVATAADGAPVVESTLATELTEFRLRDDRGKFWSAESLGPGRRVTLKAVADAAPPRKNGRNGTENFATLIEAVAPRSAWQWTAQGGPTDVAPIRTLAAITWRSEEIAYAGTAERAGAVGRPANLPAVEKGAQ